jgi:hypothetical protein
MRGMIRKVIELLPTSNAIIDNSLFYHDAGRRFEA